MQLLKVHLVFHLLFCTQMFEVTIKRQFAINFDSEEFMHLLLLISIPPTFKCLSSLLLIR